MARELVITSEEDIWNALESPDTLHLYDSIRIEGGRLIYFIFQMSRLAIRFRPHRHAHSMNLAEISCVLTP